MTTKKVIRSTAAERAKASKKKAVAECVKRSMPQIRAAAEKSLPYFLFGQRGFSKDTIDALWRNGVRLPEALLVMRENHLQTILREEVGVINVGEIVEYRKRFGRKRSQSRSEA